MVDLLLNDEQDAVQQALGDFLAAEYPIERFRGAEAPAMPERLAPLAQMGWLGIGFPEDAGGSGMGIADEALAFRAFGRFLVTPAVLGSIMAGHLLRQEGETEKVADILSGSATIGVALPAADGGYYLVDTGPGEDVLVAGEGLALARAGAIAERSPSRSIDGAVVLEHANLDANADWIVVPGTRLDTRYLLLLAALQVGIAEAVCDLAVSYSKVREQFGRLIGGFQAIKHRCADAKVRAEAALWQTIYAGLSLQEQHEDARLQVVSALLVADNAALLNASAAIQIHGGIGFTDECSAHLYLKRAQLLSRFAGGAPRLMLELSSASGGKGAHKAS